jgi:hypothetical protein
LVVGSLSTLIAGYSCHFPLLLLREWAAICSGVLASVSFLLLPKENKKWVVFLWAAFIYAAVLMDTVLPSSIDWFYNNVFDPNTRLQDVNEVKGHVLTGLFGRQSLAKILAWMPWVVILFYGFSIPTAGLAVFSTGIILATTQRGPLMAALMGWMIFILHRWFKHKDKQSAILASAGMALSILSIFVLVPSEIRTQRLNSMTAQSSNNAIEQNAIVNRNARFAMHKFAINQTLHHPLGNACIPDQDFKQVGLSPAHAHQLFLHQFRERGWIWGALHLILWIMAIIGAWKAHENSALLAGLITTVGIGLVDHPWFVINHAMLMGIFLAMGLMCVYKRPGQNLI